MRRPMVAAMVAAILAVVGGGTTAWLQAGGKTGGGKVTNVGPWTCTATIAGGPSFTLGYGITSDNDAGIAYVHGSQGVYCLVYAPHEYTSSSQAGEFMLYFGSGSPRSLYYPANTSTDGFGEWTSGFSGGRIDVWNVATTATSLATSGATTGEMDSRASTTWQFKGDGGEAEKLGGYKTPGAAYIVRADNGDPDFCYWTITLGDPTAETLNQTLALWTGTRLNKYGGNFTMPFSISIRVPASAYAGGTGTGNYAGLAVNCKGNTLPVSQVK